MFCNNFPENRIEYHESDINFMRGVINDTWALDRTHVCDGYDKSLKLLAGHIDFDVDEYPSGREYGMWTVPQKWTVKTGTLKTMNGQVLADYHRNPLELWTYSSPFQGIVGREELLPRCFSNPARPDDTPYFGRLPYRPWDKRWGFCMSHTVLESLKDEQYQVEIDVEFSDSTMKTVDCKVPGNGDKMIVLSGH